ncbi:MAG: hypothetical protein JNJ50_13230 [Acidobacteria bacterium]|nr:hypothetical protein [Acidobacteriota bacterium]
MATALFLGNELGRPGRLLTNCKDAADYTVSVFPCLREASRQKKNIRTQFLFHHRDTAFRQLALSQVNNKKERAMLRGYHSDSW